jgi:DNA (cytosine-5)-methyltransferase 1
MSNLVQSFAIPSNIATKQLKIKQTGGNRKVVISSNWLVLFDFAGGDRVVEESLGENQGFVIRKVFDIFDTPINKTKKVYSRNYKSRKNNPIETLLETGSKKLLNKSLPDDCVYLHITFKNGLITVVPMITHLARARKNINRSNMLNMFAICSSGVDTSMMEDCGLVLNSLLDYRSSEARDAKRKSDLTETGALTALRNTKSIRNVFNEDITTIDVNTILSAGVNAGLMLASIQCDEFTNVKSNKLKEESLINLNSTLDMTFDLMRIISAVAPAIVMLEQVVGFFRSDIYKMFKLRMAKWGYAEHLLIAKGSDYGSITRRERGYAVFTVLNEGFVFEQPRTSNIRLWDVVQTHLPDCRDITECKSIQDGAKCGRLRTITKDTEFSPTILKSQNRGAKDTLAVKVDGRYYMPSEGLLKDIMGCSDFKLDCVSKDIGSEIIGQSVSSGLHKMVTRCVKRHIEGYFDAKQPA